MRSNIWLFRVLQLTVALAVLVAALPAAQPAAAGWHNLTGRLPTTANIPVSRFSPDSQYVVFMGDLEVDNHFELYSVPVSGTLPVKLNPPMPVNGGIGDFAITPDSQFVIFTAIVENPQAFDLYRVPIGGGEAVKLNLPLDGGHNVIKFAIDPDNQRVVYIAEQSVEYQYELFSVLIAGGGIVRLNPDLVADGDVLSFQIDRYLHRVVYNADQDTNDVSELYGVPLAGGASVRLNPLGTSVSRYKLSPQLQLVVFTARVGGGNASLYMNATSGGLLTPLSPSLAANQSVLNLSLTPDGTHVVYVVGTGTPIPNYGNLYSVLIGGGPEVPLTAAGPGYGTHYESDVLLLSNERAIYNTQVDPQSAQKLESVALNGTGRATLHDSGGQQNYAYEVSLSANRQWVLFETFKTHQVFMVSAAGGIAEPFGDARAPRFTPDGNHIVTLVPSPLGGNDLYSFSVDGSGGPNLSNTAGQAEARNFQISPDGHYVLYLVRYPNGQSELRVSDGAPQTFVYLPLTTH